MWSSYLVSYSFEMSLILLDSFCWITFWNLISLIFLQQHQGPPNISKGALCLNHFFAILCIFSGIYLVNYVLMNSAANVFYSTGLVLLTFPDAMSLMEQVPFFFSYLLVVQMFLFWHASIILYELGKYLLLWFEMIISGVQESSSTLWLFTHLVFCESNHSIFLESWWASSFTQFSQIGYS